MDSDLTVKNYANVRELEKIPFQERIEEASTFAMLEKGAAIDPEATALSFMISGETYDQPVQVSYGDFIANIRQCANMLHDMGIGPGDVVTYLLPNAPQTHYVLWGGEAAGIVNPINPLLEPGTIRDICNAAGTKILVALGDLPGTEIWGKVDAIRKEIPTLESILAVMGQTDEANGIYSFDETVAKYNGEKLAFARDIAPDDISSLYHTGGTTGTPKLARRTHQNEAIMSWMIRTMGGMQPDHNILCGLPLFHVNGTTVTGLTPLSYGAHVVMMSPMGYRDPSVIQNFYKIVDHYKANFFSAVPTVLSALLDLPVGDADISSLKYAICGAAPLSVELFRRFEAHTGMKVLEGYGLTEGACASAINPKDGERKIGSIGIPMPYQHMTVAVTDDDGNYLREAETDEIGVIAISGPNVFEGYVEPEHNRGIWLEEGLFNTGDMGRRDKDNYFWLTGRKKELIIRGGHNLDPGMIEEVFYQCPDVKTVAAVGRPDPYAGEVPVIYVELAEGADVSTEELLEYGRRNIGEKAAAPKEIFIVDAIPLTPVGKIFKPALRWDVVGRVFQRELAGLKKEVASITAAAREDKVHGTRVEITVEQKDDGMSEGDIQSKIKEILSLYTIHYTVSFG